MPTNSAHHINHRHVLVSRSTNSELLMGLQAGAIDSSQPYLLTANSQTAGRGQHGRTWQSPVGNVYLSLYHPLQVPLSGILSLIVGYQLTRLPLIQTINRQLKHRNLPPLGVKWVNDIGFYATNYSVIGDIASTNVKIKPSINNTLDNTIDAQQNTVRFNKLAGILIEPVWTENRLMGVVVGVGLNVTSNPLLTCVAQEGLGYHAISLTQIINLTQIIGNQQVNQHGNQVDTTLANLNTGLKPNDLYFPISSAIIRAIAQFQNCYTNPYAIHKFVADYASVDVLANRQISVQRHTIQHQSSGNQHQSSANPVNQPIKWAQPVTGIAMGIDPTGGLIIKTNNNTSPIIYTGEIKVLAS